MTLAKPQFWTVTGRDFGRSIVWAKKQPRLRDIARVAAQQKKKQ